MFWTFKINKRIIKIIAVILVICLAAALILIKFGGRKETFIETEAEPCLVIDPGHGGIDGGAIALDGTKESEINLKIADGLNAYAELFGIKTVMTRSDDSGPGDMASYSEHENLVHRTEIVNSVPEACLISIHQNFYPTSQPSGAQILYAKTPGSRELGEICHKNIVSKLQPQNRRVAGPAPKELYITSHIKCPGILAECGFMSNFSDLENLKKSEYQTKLAAVLMSSYLQFNKVYN